jgi:two-component system NarL family response regulator
VGPSPEKLRVVIADDSPAVRQGLVKVLTSSGIEVVDEAADGVAAIDVVEKTAPDVVVMDLNMPRLSGTEATRRVTERAPATQVLVLTVSAEEEDVTEAILAGARGYVLKDDPLDEVVSGIRAVAAGECLISPRIASTLLGRIRERKRDEFAHAPVPLSERELDVLRLVADGKSNQEIGEKLFITSSTVRNHISSILMKLQVENRVQAAVHAVRSRMV